METLRDLLMTAAAAQDTAPALRYKQAGSWRAISYRELAERACGAAALLDRLGVERGSRVAMLMDNHPRWPEIYFGIAMSGRTAVPLDARLAPGEIPPILGHAEATVLFADRVHADALAATLQKPVGLRDVIVTDTDSVPPPDGAPTWHAYAPAVRALAPTDPATVLKHPCRVEDAASIIYTSGTTGSPKGVMLSHGNFMANVQALSQLVPITATDRFLLVLPLHHAFAFTGSLLVPLACGASISLVENLRAVGDNMREVKPTVMLGVPLLFEKLYNRIQHQLQVNRGARLLLALGLKGIVQRSIRRKLGGQLRFCVVGGAPTDPVLVTAFAELGIPLIEGYGLTETAPVLTLNPPVAPRAGSVGKPLPGVTLRIAEPDTRGIGEIIVQGPNVMAGYYRNPEATAHVLTDGWFHTGDLGTLDADGYVTIAGRRKNLIVNREGKNIYPEEIEVHLQSSPFILESLVLGFKTAEDATGERVGVIAVPDMETIESRFKREDTPVTEAAVNALLQSEIKRLSSELADYKRPRAIRIRHEPFEKTSTGKIRRFQYAIEQDVEAA